MMSKFLLILCFGLSSIAPAMAQQAKLEMISLRTQYENAVDRQVSPLRDKYLASLKALKEKYTKAGDLESALMIDKELKSESDNLDGPSSKLPLNESELREFIQRTTWIFLSDPSVKYQFDAENKIRHNDKFAAYYQVVGRRKLVMYWGGGIGKGPIECVLSEDCLAMTELSGGRNVWTRARE